MAVTLRPANLEDIDSAVPLLFQAGETLLTRIFGKGQRQHALDYLRFAWQFGAGQYGYRNHWVATEDNQVVGLITSWHDALPADFDRLTLTSLTQYFGFDGAMKIVAQNQALTENLDPPSPSQLAIGHLAVARNYRRKGIALKLVSYMEQYAQRLNKDTVVLDVENDNQDAMLFYRAIGFTQSTQLPPFVRFQKKVSG